MVNSAEYHHEQTIEDGIHIPYAFAYNDMASRLAATGFASTDIGKAALQKNDFSLWILKGNDPVAWERISFDPLHVHPSANVFSTVKVAGEADIPANSSGIINVVGGNKIKISTNPATQSVIIDKIEETSPAKHGISHITPGDDMIPNAIPGVASGLMTGADKQKLNNIAANAEKNQNSFSKIQIAGTTIEATNPTDTLTLVPSSDFILTPNNNTKTLQVSLQANSPNMTKPHKDSHLPGGSDSIGLANGLSAGLMSSDAYNKLYETTGNAVRLDEAITTSNGLTITANEDDDTYHLSLNLQPNHGIDLISENGGELGIGLKLKGVNGININPNDNTGEVEIGFSGEAAGNSNTTNGYTLVNGNGIKDLTPENNQLKIGLNLQSGEGIRIIEHDDTKTVEIALSGEGSDGIILSENIEPGDGIEVTSLTNNHVKISLAPISTWQRNVVINARNNIYYAGRPATESSNQGIPPAEVTLPEGAHRVVSFSEIVGQITYGLEDDNPWVDAEGSSATGFWQVNNSSFNGISGIKHDDRCMFLVGVFLGNEIPISGAEPPRLDFSNNSINMGTTTKLSPEIGQLFFIGDGKTASQQLQEFYVPYGATRLFLGFVDDLEYYYDNEGQFQATIVVKTTDDKKLVAGSGISLEQIDSSQEKIGLRLEAGTGIEITETEDDKVKIALKRPTQVTTTIAGTSNVYAAGLEEITSGTEGTLPTCINLPEAAVRVITFPVLSGTIKYDFWGQQDTPPEGRVGAVNVPSLNGISGIKHDNRFMFLAGVFLSNESPVVGLEPPILDFSDAGPNNMNTKTRLYPQLGQAFFIGDGRTATSAMQRFYAPTGATRLFLGLIDRGGDGIVGVYQDNDGTFNTTIEIRDTDTNDGEPVDLSSHIAADDHVQYVHISEPRDITATHTITGGLLFNKISGNNIPLTIQTSEDFTGPAALGIYNGSFAVGEAVRFGLYVKNSGNGAGIISIPTGDSQGPAIKGEIPRQQEGGATTNLHATAGSFVISEPENMGNALYVGSEGKGHVVRVEGVQTASSASCLFISNAGEGRGISVEQNGMSSGIVAAIISETNTSPAIHGISSSATTNSYAGRFEGQYRGLYVQGNDAALLAQGAVIVDGDLHVSGAKNAIVNTSHGMTRMYSEESCEVWFSDFGFGQLTEGKAIILIESLFAETIDWEQPYHVFVQSYGACNGIDVTQRTKTHFMVEERQQGKSSVEFGYKIIGKRKGYSTERMSTVKSEN